MYPRLIALAGPQRGTTYPLSGESMSIGRDSTNWICISDASASRKHCSITRSGDSFLLTDLDSRNGTSINGTPIRERMLQHGEQIELGESVFLFLLLEEETSTPGTNGEILSAIPTTKLRVEDAIYLQPERLIGSPTLTARIVRGFDALLKLSRSIHEAHQSSILFQKILESAFNITPAQRGAIVLTRSNSSDITAAHMYDRNLQKLEVGVSKTIVELVMNERQGFLSNDVLGDTKVRAAQNSLTAMKVSSLIAVPLICSGLIQGVLYMDTGDSGVRFDDDHLQLVSAIATIGAGALESVRQFEALQRDHERIIQELRIEHNMIGETGAMKELYRMIGKISPSNSTVLISGETGTGKELVARAIHFNSPRSGKSFVAINCANLSESLIESELFGHEKGAFTGAYALKIGKLELSDGGTLFLDEIGELPLSLQSRLLRVLQEREFERLGGIRPLKVDLRLLAATNKDLEASVRSGAFRQDLYYRLNVVRIHIPPLRERREDIPLLASYFASKYAGKCDRKMIGISLEARKCLVQYDWPGNVRELENAIERAVVIGTEDMLLAEDLPETVLEQNSPQTIIQYQELLKETKRKLLQQALDQANGNATQAAHILGMHPNNFYRILRNLKMKTGSR